MTDPPPRPHPQTVVHDWLAHPFIGPLTLVIAAVTMLIWTWGRYCNPIIDFGRELYVPWRLSVGEVLYRDIDYFNGPVSPYLNSLIFRIFGPSLFALEIANLFWWSVLTVMAYHLYLTISDRLGAFLAVLLFILLFSFLQLTETGNDNFVTPYSHEITHALVCAFGMLLFLRRYLRTATHNGFSSLAACGFLLGIIFLMKSEVAVAAAGALAVGIPLRLSMTRARPRQWLATALILLAAAILPSIIAFALLRLAMPSGEALRGLLGGWNYLHDPRITENVFYQKVMGSDAPMIRSIGMLETLAGQLALLLPPTVAAVLIRRKESNENRWVGVWGSVGYIFIVLWIFWDRIDWHAAMQPLNVIALGLLVNFATLVIVHRKQLTPRLILQAAFAIFAVLLLAKIFFNIGIHHYGFALSGPAFSLMVMLLLSWAPGLIFRTGGTGWILRAAALTALGAFALKYLVAYENIFRSKPAQTIGAGLDQFDSYQNAESIDLILNFLERQPTYQTVAAVPEGSMINYLARRVNPTGEPILLPGEVIMFGEDRILSRFVKHPPDWLVEVRSNVAAFGYRGFGIDYAQKIATFIRDNYDPVLLSGWHDREGNLRLMKYDRGHCLIRQSESIPALSQMLNSTTKSAVEGASHPQ